MPGPWSREPAAPARAGVCRPPSAEPVPPLTAHRLFTTRPPIRHMTITDRMTAAHHP
ncbi:hypothetical protein [Actinomyces oris]